MRISKTLHGKVPYDYFETIRKIVVLCHHKNVLSITWWLLLFRRV